jgi:hypothetical protein
MRLRQSCAISKGFVTIASLMAVVMGCLVAETAQADSEQPGRFRAACVKVDITPDTPQWLQGYGPRQSTGVHDRIYHRIAILDDGTTTFCLVSTDICTILPSFYRGFLRKASARDTDPLRELLVVNHPHPFSASRRTAGPGQVVCRHPGGSVFHPA